MKNYAILVSLEEGDYPDEIYSYGLEMILGKVLENYKRIDNPENDIQLGKSLLAKEMIESLNKIVYNDPNYEYPED